MSSFTPVVFIGLGGAGKHILLRIRRLIVENHKKLENLPSVKFLHVDTDSQLGPDAGVNIPMEVLGQNLAFKDAERCNLSHRINDEIKQSRDSIKTNSAVKEWFDPTLTLDNNFSQGAGGIRPYGRLAFHYSVDIFRQKLGNCVTEAIVPANIQKSAENLGMSVGTNLDIYIVSSLLGGTGSGTFLEVCYNSLIASKGKGVTPYVTGIFTISGADIDGRRKANCYSALMELEHHSTAFLKGVKQHFSVRYPLPDEKPLRETGSPVDLCYLVSHVGEGEYILGRDQMEEALALNLYMEFGSVISAEKKSRRVDFTGLQEFRQLDDELGRSRQFLSFGISTLEFPAPRVQDMMAQELASAALKGWLFAEKKESPDLDRDKRDIEATLEENNLIQVLLTIDNKHLLHKVNTKISEKELAIKKLIDQDNIDGELIITTAKSNIDSSIECMNFSMDPRLCGEYARQIAAKAYDKQDEIGRTINKKVHDLLENEFRGPREARAYLDSISQMLANLKSKFEAQYTSFQNAAGRAQEAVYVSGLKKIHETLGQEKFALNYHNKRVHSELLLTYLNLSAKREAYRSALSMLSTDRLEYGTMVSSLISLVDNLTKEVELYVNSLQSVSTALSDKGEEIEQTIVNTPIAEGIRLSPIRLKEITKNVVPNASSHFTTLMRHVKDSFSEKDKEGNIIKSARIMDLLNRRRNDVESILLQKCSEICENVKNISVAAELKDQPKLRDILTQKIRLSKPMIQGAGFKAGENIRLHWLATADPAKDINLKGICDTINTIYQYKGSMTDRHLSNLPDPYRIIFASEKGIFPLQRISILHDYRKDYKMIKSKHTDIRINYLDIIPTTQEEAIKKQAEEAALLGRFFGFLAQRTDPESGYDFVFMSCFDEASRTFEHRKLTDKWEDVETTLANQQIAKDIDNEETGETFLEKLEKHIEEKGLSAKTRMEKEVFWNMLQQYLDKLVKELEGGDMNQEFQRQRDVIQEFRKKFGIQPPEGERPIPVPPPDIRRLSTELKPKPAAQPSNQFAAEGKFRIVIEEYFKKGIHDKDKLIKYGVFMLKLSQEEAATIFDEVAGQGGNLEQRLQSYRDGFEAVIMNGEITAEERAILKQNQAELGLTDEQVRQIEGPHTKPIYLEYFQLAVTDDKIDPFERARLRGLQEALYLSDDQVKEIESDYSFVEE